MERGGCGGPEQVDSEGSVLKDIVGIASGYSMEEGERGS